MSQTVKFSRTNNAEFVKAVKANVGNYFKDKKISKFGNYRMVLKSLFMLTLYLTPYFFIILADIENTWIFLGLWAIMGFGMSGIGLSIMHDANHGSYSKKPIWNKIMSGAIYLVGANALNWKIQHNVLHHTYTNISGHDQDIDAPFGLLRFSPHQKRMKIHKYQHFYAWFFYSLLTLTWAFDADFRQIYDFKRLDLIKGYRKNFSGVMFELIFFKALYYVYILAIPMILSSQPWWICLAGFLMMQMISGVVLASIFQSAHVVPVADFPIPDKDGKMENNWLVHQLHTTANFAQKNKAFTWFVGGLNHQVEHHLFPTICHVHYPKISKIVKETAEEYGLPYHSYPTFRSAVAQHVKLLKDFGRS